MSGRGNRAATGFVRGHYYADYVEDVKELRRSGRELEAQKLLLELVDATEAEARAQKWAIAPWYYQQLAISYRKSGDLNGEIAILERYARRGYGPQDSLVRRLAKAKGLAQRG